MGAEKFLITHENKAKLVKQLTEKINKSKTLMIVSIKGLPSKQFQDIKKIIREHGEVRVAKKNILVRTLKAFGKESILELEPFVTENCAFIFSDLDGFELAGILNKNKTPLFAKAGQIAVSDIEIKSGPTDLMPGPAISELGALGIQISIENGKISIKQSRVVVKTGEEIKANAASMLQKLHIQPFKIGLEPLVVYDTTNEKVYTDIKIDSEGIANELKLAAAKALGFAQKINYYCKETIGYLLAKAQAHGKALAKKNVQLNTPEEKA
ncbi:MAG: 50S ribosomal protein L10 [Candidatus Pacearchaeota archaeon]